MSAMSFSRIFRVSSILAYALLSHIAMAATYNFSGTVGGSNYPTCSGGSWSGSLASGTVTCAGSVSLANGDILMPASALTVAANAGITLSGNNTVGSSTTAVNLQTAWGNLVASGISAVYGNMTATSQAINLTDTTVTGNVTANSGAISLTGGSVGGAVHSDCCAISTTNTNISGGVSSTNNSVAINGGTIAGTISSSGGSGITIQNATITSGSITATSVPIAISNSTVYANITGNNTVSLSNNSAVIGNVTSAAWPGALSIDSTSHVLGTCTPSNVQCGTGLLITAATVDSASSTTVAPGASVAVSYAVAISGGSSRVRGTYWMIGTTPPPTTCADSSPDSPSNTDGNYTTGFTATAPATAGTYNLYLIANNNNSCTGTRSSALFTLSNAVVVAVPPPSVVSINRASFDPTKTNTSVTWTVVFNTSVTGVGVSDFALVQSGGATGASITSVTNSGDGITYTVTANTGSAAGSLQLKLVDDDSIVSGSMPLGGAGTGNGNFSGQTYTILASVCTGASDILFCDDFERSNPESVGNGWAFAEANSFDCNGTSGNRRCAGIDSDIPPFSTYTNPRAFPTRSMFTRWAVVTVTSPTVSLAGQSAAELSFTIRRGHDSFSECPEAAGENYLVQYYASDNSWKTLAQYPSSPSADLCDGKTFLPVIELPSDALHAGFRMRFYQPSGSGDSGSGGAPNVRGYDYWHMDDIVIRAKSAPTYVGAFCDNFEAGLSRWSISAEGAGVSDTIGDAGIGTADYQSASHSLDMRWGYVVASTFKTDLRNVTGNITYWAKSGSSTTLDPDNGENLVVEYLNSSSVWTTLATYLGSDTGGTVYSGSHTIPPDALHQNFRLRFRHLNASGYDRDYWRIDDVCVGNLLPTADLSLSKTGEANLVPGTNTTYTLTATNNGPGTLSGSMQIVDTLPSGLSFMGSSGTGWICSGDNITNQVTCNWSGTLANGTAAPTLSLIASVGSISGLITNTATVSGTVVDNTSGNNTATFTSGTYTPAYIFTNGACVKDIAIGSGGQTCTLVSWTDQVAGIANSGIYITAINSSNVPTALSTSSATAVGLQFGLTCHNPTTDGGIQATFSATASALPLCASSGQIPSNWTTSTSVSFTANSPSVGPYSFNYNDVGRVELYTRNSAATSQMGSTGTFVVKPYGIKLDLTCASSFSTESTAYCPAGETVSGTVTAVRYDSSASNNLGTATPNFGKTAIDQMATVVGTSYFTPTLTAPSTGTATAYDNFAWVDTDGSGVWTNGEGVTLSWPEVGTVKLTSTLDYLGAGDLTTAGKASSDAYFGAKRFYPYRIMIADNGSAEGCAACDLTYIGQPFQLGFTLTALNKQGNAVKNYGLTGYTQRATTNALSVVAENNNNGTNLGSNVKTYPANATPSFTPTWADPAVATFAAANFSYQRTTPVAQMDNLLIGVKFVDDSGDAVPLLGGNMDATSSGDTCATTPATTCTALSTITTKLRYGRLRIVNFYGSELLAPRVEYRSEYWDGSRWLTNTLDTGVGATTIPCLLPFNAATCAISTGSLAVSAITGLTGGVGFITFNAAAPGSYDIAINLNTAGSDTSCNTTHSGLAANMPWLQGEWSGNCNGTAAGHQDPSARIRLGTSKSPYIYMRERY